jgi:ectoine hydroxylase-related dioxygenase (phytanoyl-CoA dioxygenase family)
MLDEEVRDRLRVAGFLHLKKVFGPTELGHVEALLDPLLERFEGLPSSRAHRPDAKEGGPHLIRDLNRASVELPALKETEVYRRSRELARDLLSVRRVGCSFDHVIYKDPGAGPVDWHQDQVYKTSVPRMRSVHLWIPFHPVGRENGCMQFVEGSHRGGLKPHRSVEGTRVLGSPPEEPYTAEMDLGDVSVHLPLTVHRSLPNRSSTTRRAWILHFSRFGRWEVITPRNVVDLVSQRFWRRRSHEAVSP